MLRVGFEIRSKRVIEFAFASICNLCRLKLDANPHFRFDAERTESNHRVSSYAWGGLDFWMAWRIYFISFQNDEPNAIKLQLLLVL